MFEYTKDNHYQFGWNNVLWNTPTDDLEEYIYQWKIGKLEKRLSWKESCLYAAQHIETYNEDIWIAFSGGIDSEVTIRSFIEQGIKVNAAIIKFKNGINHKDVKYAIDFCNSNNINYRIFTLDVIDFITNHSNSYINKYKMISPQIPVQLWLLDNCDEFLVFCGGDMRLNRTEGTMDDIYITIKPQTSTVHRAMIKQEKKGVPYFHIHTPEQVYGFLNDPMTTIWKQHSYSMRMLSIKWFKPVIYETSFPNLKPRQKLTGFELIEGLENNLRNKYESINMKYNPDIHIKETHITDMLLNKSDKFLYSNCDYT